MPKNCRYCGINLSYPSARGMSLEPSGSPGEPKLNETFLLSRYSADLTPDQKDALLDVVRANPHPQIGPEVRRELVNSVARGEPRPDADPDVQMSL